MANLNIKSNNDKTITKIDCKGIFIFNTTGCKENSIYLNENVDVYGNDIETLKIYVSDLLPNDNKEYNNEDLCINIDYTNIQDVIFSLYDNPKNDIYDYRINIKEKTLGSVELIFEKYNDFNNVRLFISNMIDDDININPICECKEHIHINNKL